MRERRRLTGDNSAPTINVLESFVGGGAGLGLSFNQRDLFELHNFTSRSAGNHTFKAGGQARAVRVADSSTENFGGTFVFAGGLAPQLDADDRLLLGSDGQPTWAAINSLERYRRTLVFGRRGLTPSEVRALGGGASQFRIMGGDPSARAGQFNLGAFAQDDWRLQPNFMLSLGLRYEMQPGAGGKLNFAPRVAFAWSPERGSKQPQTVLRGGMGIFYERFDEQLSLLSRRFDGQHRRQFYVTDPTFLDLFPQAPSIEQLSASAVPQAVRRVADNLRSPLSFQSSFSVERELPHGFTLAATYIHNWTLRALLTRNTNAPRYGNAESGARPFPALGEVFEYESSGLFKQHQLSVNVVNRFGKRMAFYATYVLNKAESDTDGADSSPLDSSEAASDFGRSALDVRHSFYLGGWLSAPLGLDFHTLLFVRSGLPFNITTGRDTNGDALFNERPAFAADLGRASVVRTRFGAFDLEPLPGQRLIPRNFGVGDDFFSVNLGVSRTFRFGHEVSDKGKGRSGRLYSMTFSAQVENLFNRANQGAFNGNLGSPLFGQPYASAGSFGFGSNAAGNRRLSLQVSFGF